MQDRPAKKTPAAMTVAELGAFLDEVFPEMHLGGRFYFVEAAGHGSSRVRLAYHARHLRPGGTISGPAMMTLADYAVYVAILASIGRVPLAVTTNLSINFLRKPAPRDLIAECRLLKLGKRLAVAEAGLFSEGETDLAAHVTATYSIPPSS